MRHDEHEFCGSSCTKIADERGNYSTHVFTREAISIIERHDSESGPLFLYLAHQGVHFPDQVPDKYLEKYRNRKQWSKRRRVYAGMLSAVDESIQNVTEALKANDLWENTVVVGTTDNGGPTSVCMVQGSSNGRLRGGKCTVWEGGTKGDAFLSGPALKTAYGIESPFAYQNLFHAVDWLPTLANMTGAKPEGKKLDGVCHLKSLQTKMQASSPPREELFVGYAEYNPEWGKKEQSPATAMWYGPAIRWKQWKLIQGQSGGPEHSTIVPDGAHTPSPGGIDGDAYLLFNLLSDPAESHDVSQDFPLIVEIMKSKLAVYQQSFVPPIAQDETCLFHGIVNTSFGPTWIPWCDQASQIVLSG